MPFTHFLSNKGYLQTNMQKRLLFLLVFLSILVQAKAQQILKNLNYYTQEADKNNPLIKDNYNQQQAAKIDSMLIRSGAKLQVVANGAGLYAPIIKGYGYDMALSNGQALEALLQVNYDLLNKKRINNQLQALQIRFDSIKYATQLSKLDLKKLITEQYITTYASQQQLEFNQKIYSLLKEEEDLLKKLTRANTYKQTEYLTFLVTFKQQQLQWKQAEISFKNDIATLNYLAGVSDTSKVILEAPFLALETDLVNRTFFIERFKIDSLSRINQKKAISLNYQPKLSVYANGGYNSSFILQPYKNFGSSIGFMFSLPIYDGHQKKMQFDKIALSSQTNQYYKSFFIKQQQQQINLIREQINYTDELLLQINEQIKLTKSLIDVDGKLIPTGDIRIADFAIAINNYRDAQNLLEQTTISRFKLLNQLNYWNR